MQNTTVLVVPNTWRYVSGCTSAPEKDLAEPQKCSQIVCRSHGGARKNLPPSSLTFVLAVLPLRASALLRKKKGSAASLYNGLPTLLFNHIHSGSSLVCCARRFSSMTGEQELLRKAWLSARHGNLSALSECSYVNMLFPCMF